MIYAVSLNPCIDKSAVIQQFDPDRPNRVQVERLDIGGKGVNVARVAKALGTPCLLAGFDYRGGPVKAAMEREGIPCRLLPVDGDLRVNLKIRETAGGRTLEINEGGAKVSAEALEACLSFLTGSVRAGDWVSLSGSLPPGADADTYRRFCASLKEKGAQVAVDCDGPALKEALKAGPDLIKPNAQEFVALTGISPDDEKQTAAACKALMDGGVGRVCLSRGGDGALLFTKAGRFSCPAAPVQALGVQGAGDTLLSALLTAFHQGMAEGEALRFAVSAAGASVMRPGTLLCAREDALALLSAMPPAAYEAF